jgi:hypothetical protein
MWPRLLFADWRVSLLAVTSHFSVLGTRINEILDLSTSKTLGLQTPSVPNIAGRRNKRAGMSADGQVGSATIGQWAATSSWLLQLENVDKIIFNSKQRECSLYVTSAVVESNSAKELYPCSDVLTITNAMLIESSWNVTAHGDARQDKWRGNWRMEWVASTLHTTSEHGVSSITTAAVHTSAASSRLYWGPCRFKWTRPFRRKTKSGFCACAITFQAQSTTRLQSALLLVCENSLTCALVFMEQ